MEPVSMIQAIFNAIGQAITSFGGVIGNGFSSAVALFWNGTALTDTGTLMLIGAGVGLVWFAVALIMKLIRPRVK